MGDGGPTTVRADTGVRQVEEQEDDGCNISGTGFESGASFVSGAAVMMLAIVAFARLRRSMRKHCP